MTNQPANAGSGRGNPVPPLGRAVRPQNAAGLHAPPPPALHHQAPPRPAAANRPASFPAAANRPASFPASFPAAAATRDATAPRRAPATPNSGHRAPRTRDAARDVARANEAARPRKGEPTGIAWLPYLIALAGVGVGVFMVCQGARYTGLGAGLIGCSLLAAGLARLVLPPRLAGLLASRRRTSDVLAFAAFGAGVLAVALMLP